jgi:hypothetical protein
MRPCRRSEADELETGPIAREGWEAAVPQPSLGGRFAPITEIRCAPPGSGRPTLRCTGRPPWGEAAHPSRTVVLHRVLW